jgi:hypothetical protein
VRVQRGDCIKLALFKSHSFPLRPIKLKCVKISSSTKPTSIPRSDTVSNNVPEVSFLADDITLFK